MLTNLPSSDCFAVIPDALPNWYACVDAWNDILAYVHAHTSNLRRLLVQGIQGGPLDEQFVGFFENDLDRLNANLQRAAELQQHIFHQALQLRYGLGIGSVYETEVQGASERILVEIQDGGLPGRDGELKLNLGLRVVVPFQGGWLSARPTLLLCSFNPDEAAFRHRPEIKPTRPGDSSLHWFPLELGGPDVFNHLRPEPIPGRPVLDRKDVLFAFWEESLRLQAEAKAAFKREDILAVIPASRPRFHVAYECEPVPGTMYCYDPRTIKSADFSDSVRLQEVTVAGTTNVKVVRPRTSFAGRNTTRLVPEVLHAFALRENLRHTGMLDAK